MLVEIANFTDKVKILAFAQIVSKTVLYRSLIPLSASLG